jgi:hypothetical protein
MSGGLRSSMVGPVFSLKSHPPSVGTPRLDPVGRCHAVANLSGIDARLFVTGSSESPTATARVPALRTADPIAATRREA